MAFSHNDHTILVLEDDDDFRETLSLLLTSEGYKVVSTATAQAAINHLYNGARPSLILLDLLLPGKGGDEFAAELGSNSLFDKIPIMVVSGHTADSNLTNVLKILEKPIDKDVMLMAIKNILQGLIS